MFENKSNSKIMLLGTSKASLGKIWYTQCLLPTLVGKFEDNDSINLSSYAVEGDMINYIYLSVKIPVVAEAFRDFAKKWGQYREDILNQYPEKRQSQAREDVEGTLHPELFNLLQKGALIKSGDTYYIKFYVDTIDWKNKDDIIMGTLFNGTQVIHLGGNTPSTQQLLRGGQVQLCACDELGEFTGSITGSVLPAVISGKGRMIACGTPNSKGVLSTAIREALGVVTGSTSKQEEVSGLRLYTAKKESPVFNDLGEIEKIDSYTETTIIGELEKIYPYGYDGINKFNAAQSSRTTGRYKLYQ
jgi:hypothetical protein